MRLIKIKADWRILLSVNIDRRVFHGAVGVMEKVMIDKDRVVGSTKVVKGKIKEALGKAVGDAKLEAEGTADKIEGKVQNAVGGLKDAIKGK
jgi:uncharacterized protein YjbJ (UPF0337 family)